MKHTDLTRWKLYSIAISPVITTPKEIYLILMRPLATKRVVMKFNPKRYRRLCRKLREV